MGIMTAFALGQLNQRKELMVFDWNKAARIIKETGANNAVAGLLGDWDRAADILVDSKIPEYSDTYLASTWATPGLEVNGEVVSCYKMQSETNGWGCYTFWPESAREILGV